MKPKKKKKKKRKKKLQDHHLILEESISTHYISPPSPLLANINNRKQHNQDRSSSSDTESPSPLLPNNIWRRRRRAIINRCTIHSTNTALYHVSALHFWFTASPPPWKKKKSHCQVSYIPAKIRVISTKFPCLQNTSNLLSSWSKSHQNTYLLALWHRKRLFLPFFRDLSNSCSIFWRFTSDQNHPGAICGKVLSKRSKIKRHVPLY